MICHKALGSCSLWERVIESVPEEMGRLLVASIQDASPSSEAIKQAVQNQFAVPGAEVYRGNHLRVASGETVQSIPRQSLAPSVNGGLCGLPLAKRDFKEPIDDEIALRVPLNHIAVLEALGGALDARR